MSGTSRGVGTDYNFNVHHSEWGKVSGEINYLSSAGTWHSRYYYFPEGTKDTIGCKNCTGTNYSQYVPPFDVSWYQGDLDNMLAAII